MHCVSCKRTSKIASYQVSQSEETTLWKETPMSYSVRFMNKRLLESIYHTSTMLPIIFRITNPKHLGSPRQSFGTLTRPPLIVKAIDERHG